MKQLLLYLLFTITVATNAQEKDSYLKDGNKDFLSKKYDGAEENYRISASKFPKNAKGSYNLGNAIYNIKQPAEAGLAYAKAIVNSKNRPEKHSAYHNIGNVYMKLKDYSNAVNAYKQALINDPTDEESRYNFALAKKMLKENPPKKDDKKDKKKEDKKKEDKKKEDKKKEEEDKKKNEDKKDGKDKDKKEEQPKGKPKPKEGGISKERLQNLLDAVNQEEKKIQDKVNKNKVKGAPVKTEKDW